MIAVIDYGIGNLFSLCSGLKSLGEDAIITSDKEEIKKCDRIILPGVGAFGDAIKRLNEGGLSDFIKDEAKSGKPILGICLGMQLLFDKSYEYGEHEGLGLIPGKIVPISGVISKEYKIPHIGWNPLVFSDKKSRLLKSINNGDCVYFVHSYFADECKNFVTSSAEYGTLLTASVERNNVYGTQFHPEKSGSVGLSILKAFCEI